MVDLLRGPIVVGFFEALIVFRRLRRVVLAGATTSIDLPATTTTTLQGGRDGFVAVLDSSQTGAAQLVWATYVGGTSNDKILDEGYDSAGNVFVVGSTESLDLPVTPDEIAGQIRQIAGPDP